VWQQLENKHLPVHQGLYRGLLTIKSKDFSVSIPERRAAAEQAAAIKADLDGAYESLAIDYDDLDL
ncbi:hypothetical protein ACW9HQ_38490, partial [Nocardia gipuzkoensis]